MHHSPSWGIPTPSWSTKPIALALFFSLGIHFTFLSNGFTEVSQTSLMSSAVGGPLQSCLELTVSVTRQTLASSHRVSPYSSPPPQLKIITTTKKKKKLPSILITGAYMGLFWPNSILGIARRRHLHLDDITPKSGVQS